LPNLASPHSRARHSIVSKVVVNVNSVSRVSLRNVARDRNEWTRRSGASTASDGNLRTFRVELRDSRGPRVMNSERLDLKQIIAIFETGRDGGAVGREELPGRGAVGEGGADVEDLEPVLAGAVVGGGGGGGFGHVPGDGAVVVDSGIEGEGYLGAGCDGDGLSIGAVSADVAAEVIGGEISDWRVVVGVGADVLVLVVLDTVHGQVFEDVMSIG